MKYKKWITREFIHHHIELLETWARDMTFGSGKQQKIAEQIKEMMDKYWGMTSASPDSFLQLALGFPLREINWSEIANEYLSLVKDFHEPVD